MKASELAGAISERFGVSVLLRGDLGEKSVAGRLLGPSAAEAVEGLAFLVGSKARVSDGGKTWFVGSEDYKVVKSFPAYGLTMGELRQGLRDGVALLGGLAVVEGDVSRVAQVGEILGSLSNRVALTVELTLLDVATNEIDRVNAWVDSVNVAGGYATRAAAAVAVPSAGAAQAVGALRRGWQWDVELRGLFAMLETGGSARLDLRQQAAVLSGSRTTFEAGEVIETPLIVREPQTGRDLVSSIERRTVGLVVNLGAVKAGAGWVVDLEVRDGSLANGREVRTGLTTQAVLAPGQAVMMLGSYTRKTATVESRDVPGLSKIPKLGRALFHREVKRKGERAVVILLRPLGESGAVGQ